MSRYLLLTICAALGGCGSSGSSSTLDAAPTTDAATGTGGTTMGTGAADSGGNGTGGVGGAGGTRAGTGGIVGAGGVATGTGGLGTGGTKPGSGGATGVGGAATGGSPGTGGLGTGGTKPGSGGATGVGGAATGGTPGTGGLGTGGTKPGSGGATGVGGAATGGTPGTGGSTAPACPDSWSYVGDSAWPDKLVVTPAATYCGHFKEMRNLEQEYAAKAKLTIAAGTYPLATTAGTYDFALPVCFERRPGEPIPAFAGAGTVKTTPYKSTVNTFASCSHGVTQPIASDPSASWIFSMRLSYFSWTGPPQPPVLDGGILDQLSSGEVGDTRPGYGNALELCDGTACDDQWQDVLFEACNPDYPLQRHTITFAGGQIALDVRITGAVGVTVMTAAFTRASGTLNGTAFTQTDYWKLIYSADHHHFNRSFAVLFDAPIAGACGLKVLNFWGSRFEAPLPDVYTIKCDLSNIAAAAVSDATVTLP